MRLTRCLRFRTGLCPLTPLLYSSPLCFLYFGLHSIPLLQYLGSIAVTQLKGNEMVEMAVKDILVRLLVQLKFKCDTG